MSVLAYGVIFDLEALCSGLRYTRCQGLVGFLVVLFTRYPMRVCLAARGGTKLGYVHEAGFGTLLLGGGALRIGVAVTGVLILY